MVTGDIPSTFPPGNSGPPFVSEERLYLTKDGKVVGEDDPDRHELLVAEGGQIPFARAKELGLVSGDGGDLGARAASADLPAEDGPKAEGSKPAETAPPETDPSRPAPQQAETTLPAAKVERKVAPPKAEPAQAGEGGAKAAKK